MSDQEETVTEKVAKSLSAITPSQLIRKMEHLLSFAFPDGRPKKSQPMMIWGPMGIGKTQITHQLAKKWRMDVVALHLAQFDPTDIKGIPVRLENGRVLWVTSSYLPQQAVLPLQRAQTFSFYSEKNHRDQWFRILDAHGNVIFTWDQPFGNDTKNSAFSVDKNDDNGMITLTVKDSLAIDQFVLEINERAILFLDELSAADRQTQNSALQLVLDKRINEYVIPPLVPVVAAGNRESDGAFVQPMSAPLANRFEHTVLTVDRDDFLDFATSNGCNADIVGYCAAGSKTKIFDYKAERLERGDMGINTPRSWMALSDQMYPGMDEWLLESIIRGTIGEAVGEDFISFRKNRAKYPNPDDILFGRDYSDKMKGQIEATIMFSIMLSTLSRFYELYEELYEGKNGAKQDLVKWEQVRANYVDFSLNHVDKKKEVAILAAHLILSGKYQIPRTALKSEDFAKWARQYKDLYAKVLGVSK